MKAKSTNKFLSVALALFMLLMSVPFSMFATTVRAEETGNTDSNTHVFESKKMTPAEGIYTDGQEVKYDDDFFTIHMSSKTKIDKSSKKWEDGYESDYRLNFGGAGVSTGTTKNVISFTTTVAATVKIWFVQGGEDNRQMAIWVSGEKDPTVTTELEGMKKNEPYYAELSLEEGGTYLLGGATNNNNIYKVEVAETPAVQDHVFESKKMTPAEGIYTDGQEVKYDDDFFTIHMSSKTKIDKSSKKWEDDYESDYRLNFGGAGVSTGTTKNVISFTTTAAATVKIWFVQGGEDNRQMAIWVSGEKDPTVTTELEGMKKNEPYYAELFLEEGGTYLLGGATNNNNIYKVEVIFGGGKVVRGDWTNVEDPTIESVDINSKDNGKIDVTVAADVSDNGGDKVSVSMLDESGAEVSVLNSSAKKNSHTVTFTPSKSGKYTFTAKLIREGETDKVSKETKSIDFLLPLGTPTISSATSKGNGTVEVIWGEVDEATEYEVFVGGVSKGTTKETTFMVTGLKVGEEYSITVAAKRDTETGKQSDAKTVTTTQEAQMTWGYTYFGSSIDESGKNDGYTGSALDDKVTMFSTGGKGKVATSGGDSIPFYYTAVPTDKNFTFRVNVHIDSWTRDGDQQGFGILAIDSLPDAPTKSTFLSNQYMVVVSKMEYWWDEEKQEVDPNKLTTSGKYEYRVGAGVNARIDDGSNTYPVVQYPLDNAPEKGIKPGKYNILGNCTDYSALEKDKIETIPEGGITDFIFEIQKNNTGYFCTYYDAKDGKTIIGQQKFYDPDALSKLDKDNVYVGLFAARQATATFTNIKLTTIDPEDDDPAEEKPVEKIQPVLTVGSSSKVANSDKYKLLIKSNVAGTAEVKLAGKTVATGLILSGEDKYTEQVVTIAPGTNKVEVIFTPDADQELPEGTELSSADPITTTLNVKYETYFANQKNLYVSPKGTKGGNGGKEYPLDIYTAVNVAQPGQTIILMEGTYELTSQVLIDRGMDGTAENPINMIADPEAKTRPVLDFKGTKSGLKTGGNYWYFQGFDVKNAGEKTPGFIVGGNNITVDNVNAYDNTDTGIYIKAFRDSNDPKDYWPSNNLILNCTSHNNSDASYADADGFACKLTTGEGNVFDGCIAYNNADDGWDLYAKLASGPISPVTVQNCVAYGNGYLEDGTNAGNGNGFKLGGENLSGKHKIINSVAFNNKANGITSNSCPDIIIENCTSFNNGYEKDTKDVNVTVYTNVAGDTNFSISGIISFRDDKVKDINDSLKPQGKQTVDDLKSDNNYYWLDGKSVNKSGKEVTADMFESLEFKGSIARNADNTINMEGFLVLKDNAPKDAGARMGATPSKDFTVTPDSELPPPTGFEVTLIVVVIAISAAVAIVLFKKRKSSK